MKIRIFRTRERCTSPVWEVTEKHLRVLTDLGEGERVITLSDVVESLEKSIVSFSVAAANEPDGAYLYHSFLLRK